MSQIALIKLEGPIANGDDLRSAQPQWWSIPLYEAIRSQFRTVALTSADEEIARDWLRKANLGGWSSVMCWNKWVTYEDWRIDIIREFQANAWDIAFLLDDDPDVAIVAQSMGVLSLKLGLPLNRVGWKPPDQGFRAWDEVESTLESRP